MKKAGNGGVIVNYQVLPLHPIGRLGEAKEVASMVSYLISDEAFLTGATYLADGGYTAP